MAAIPASITVNFTSNYAGPHRICWRIGGSGPYNCTTIVSCPGGGNPCTGVITMTVDNESCDPVVFNGYVQAACEAEGSGSGQVPFTNTFTPNPDCKGYTIACESVSVDSIAVTNPGTGYNPAVPPVVSIATGPGIGATATAIVGDDGILTETITNGGTGYVNGTYTNVPAVNISGTGSGATYDVVVAGGIVTSITLHTPLFSPPTSGTGYAISDTFNFNNAALGGAGSGVIVTVDTLDTGMITWISMTTTGSGYVAVPSVTVPAPGVGVQATLLATLAPCADYNPGTNCNATAKPSINLELGESTITCSGSVPPPPENPTSGITITQDACCYDCTSYTIEKGDLDGTAVIIGTVCNAGKVAFETTITGGYTNTACLVTGSLVVQEQDGGSTTVTPGAACP